MKWSLCLKIKDSVFRNIKSPRPCWNSWDVRASITGTDSTLARLWELSGPGVGEGVWWKWRRQIFICATCPPCGPTHTISLESQLLPGFLCSLFLHMLFPLLGKLFFSPLVFWDCHAKLLPYPWAFRLPSLLPWRHLSYGPGTVKSASWDTTHTSRAGVRCHLCL